MRSDLASTPALSFGARLMRIAEERGYRGEGSVVVPIHAENGYGVMSVIVTKDEFSTAPEGSVIYHPEKRQFSQYVRTEEGEFEWAELGDTPTFDLVRSDTGAISTMPLPAREPDPKPEPETDLSIITDTTTLGNATPGPYSLKSNGHLKHGSGNRATDMIVASNGEVTLAGGIRFFRRGETFQAVVQPGMYPVYHLHVDDSTDKNLKDWTWVYSASLENDRNGKCLTDVYGVHLTVTCISTGKSLEFDAKFDRDTGVMHFIDAANGLDIKDNTTDANGRVMQNIQRIAFYLNQLGKPEMGQTNTKTPIGEYVFTMSAYRLWGNAPIVVAQWGAVITDKELPPPVIEPEPEPEVPAEPPVVTPEPEPEPELPPVTDPELPPVTDPELPPGDDEEEPVVPTEPTEPEVPAEPEQDDMSFILAEPLTASNASPPQQAMKSNGSLLTGSGLYANQMVVADNGELSLAGGCMFYRRGQPFPADVEGDVPTYRINVNASAAAQKDWTWLYSAVLVNRTNGDSIPDLYDVFLDVEDMDNGGKLTFVASFEDGVFHMKDEANSLDIIDNTTDATGAVCQNAQRITFYVNQMGNIKFGDINNTPIGNFEFTITALRKRGEVEPVICQWRAAVVDEAV